MMQFEAREVGGRIAQARKEAGLTQEQLAELAAFSKRSLGDYETGVTVPYKHLREIGRLLNKPTDWFLYGDRSTDFDGDEMRSIIREEVVAALGDVKTAIGRVEERLEVLEPPEANVQDTS